MQPPRHLAQLSICRVRLGILDIETQGNYIQVKWIQRLLNSLQCSLERSNAVMIETNP